MHKICSAYVVIVIKKSERKKLQNESSKSVQTGGRDIQDAVHMPVGKICDSQKPKTDLFAKDTD